VKPPLRTKSVGTKVSEAEVALLEERARGAGMRLAQWVREALLAAPVEPVAGSGVDSGEVALGEILALRSLLERCCSDLVRLLASRRKNRAATAAA
jgi:hypothetical protein